MTVKERLIEFAKTKEKSVRAFETKCGLVNGYVNAIRVSIQPDKVESIARQYPDLNTGWLMTGEGSMLKTEEPVASSPDANLIASQQRIIENLSATIENLSETIKNLTNK